MNETRSDTGARDAELGLTEGELGHSTLAALTDAEHRRWVTRCRDLEQEDSHPWPEAQSRALVAAVLGCLYGDDVSTVATPARAWARANPSMGIVVRRIGCLRELFAQEGVIGGGDSAARLAAILDKVTIHSTETALAALDAGDTASMAEDVVGWAAPAPLLSRRRLAYGALGLAALAAVVAVALLALPSSQHHAPKAVPHGATPGATPGPGGAGAPGGAGSDGTPTRSHTPSVGGPASGSTVVRTVSFGTPVGGAPVGGGGAPAGGVNPGTGGGTGGSSGGSGGGTSGSSLPLPGGPSVPVPTLPSLPALPIPAIPTPSVPALPTPLLPSLAVPTLLAP